MSGAPFRTGAACGPDSNIERSLVMVASTLTHQPDPAIPNIVCPKCGLRMQVAAIGPVDNDDRTVTFGCDCGHRYDLSERAIVALARDSSDRW